MKHAMIMKKRVIGIVEQDDAPNWPSDDKGNKVTAIPCDDTVKIGMVYDAVTNTFADYVPSAKAPNQMARIEILLNRSKEEIENAAIDAYTEELIEGGLL